MSQPDQKIIEGKYEVIEKLGEGGIGAIYKVRHRLLDEVRVIKVLRQESLRDVELRQRFFREAKTAVQLRHPNIAQHYDFSVDDGGVAYLVMEYIDGVTLQALLFRCGPPSVALGVELARQGLEALSYLHRRGYVHRDISPDNMMVTRDFEQKPLVKLIDLGIAKGIKGQTNLTISGTFLGKIRYSPPEQFADSVGAVSLDQRSDIYSYGVLLYELLTGRCPVAGESFADLATAHLLHPPLDFRESDPDGRVPEPLRRVVLKALEKDPDQRIATAEELAQLLGPFATTPESMEQELVQTLELTSSAILEEGEAAGPRAPGSTQHRLDVQFGPKATPLPGTHVVDEFDEHFEKLKLVDKQRAERAAGAAETGAPAAPPPEVGGGRKRGVLVAGLLLAAALVGGGLWLALRLSGDRAPTGSVVETASLEPAVPISLPGRWTAGAGEGTGLALPSDEELLAAVDEAGEGAENDGGEAAPAPRPTPVVRPPADPPAAPEPEETELEETEPAIQPTTTETYRPDPGVVPPVLLTLPKPTFPRGARARELEVIVNVLVSEQGSVLTATVEKNVRRRFREAAIEVAKRATFRPAERDGIAGRMWTDIRILFTPE